MCLLVLEFFCSLVDKPMLIMQLELFLLCKILFIFNQIWQSFHLICLPNLNREWLSIKSAALSLPCEPFKSLATGKISLPPNSTAWLTSACFTVLYPARITAFFGPKCTVNTDPYFLESYGAQSRQCCDHYNRSFIQHYFIFYRLSSIEIFTTLLS